MGTASLKILGTRLQDWVKEPTKNEGNMASWPLTPKSCPLKGHSFTHRDII